MILISIPSVVTSENKNQDISSGVYTLLEQAGETAGGTSINFETKVYLFDTSGHKNAYITRDGYQTSARYWATPTLTNNKLTLTYDECGSELYTLYCNTKTKGEVVLQITSENGKYIFSGSMFEAEDNLDKVIKSQLNTSKDKVVELTD
jgi:uncharacterized surface anchored protein